MRGKVALPVGCVVAGLVLLAIDWCCGLGLIGVGIGCMVGGMATLAWRAGRHYQCE